MSADSEQPAQFYHCMNCGSKMESKETTQGAFYACPNKSCYEGRNFCITHDAQMRSFCSCDCGRAPLQFTDYGPYRLYECGICRMKLVVAVGDRRVEGVIEGTNSDDVSRVVRETLSSAGAADASTVNPDTVVKDLVAVQSAFENEQRRELWRLHQSCTLQASRELKARRKEIKKRVTDIGTELKMRTRVNPSPTPLYGDDEVSRTLLAERRRLAVEIRDSYSSEYGAVEAELVDKVASHLRRQLRPEYRIAQNPRFGNLSPDLLDPLFGLNAEVKVIDERDDYWVARGIKQALAYCEIGRFRRAQFILINFSSIRYLVSEDLRDGKWGGRVDVIAINLSDPPSAGLAPVVIDSKSVVNFLDVGGAGNGYFTDDVDTYIGRPRLRLNVEEIDREIL